MTEEVFYFLEDEEGEIFTNHGLNDNAGGGTSDVDDTPAANSKSMLRVRPLSQGPRRGFKDPRCSRLILGGRGIRPCTSSVFFKKI